MAYRAVRAIFAPVPPIAHIRRLWRQHPTRFVLALALLVRLAWLAVALGGAQFQVPVERFSHVAPDGMGYMRTPVQVVDIWARWDAYFYLWIAEHGYTEPRDPLAVAFFPVFPLTIAAVHAATGVSYLASGLILANIFDAIAWCLLAALARRRLHNERAMAAVLAFACFPTRNFGFSVYTEGLFLLLSVAAFLAYEQRRFGLASVCATILSAVRPQGVLVGFALWVDACLTRRRDGAAPVPVWAQSALTCAPLGLAVYMAYLGHTFGDPLAFLHVQQVWRRQVGSPLRVFGAHAEPHEYGVLFAAGAMLYGMIRRRWPLRDVIYVGASLLVPMSTGMLTSITRFVGVLFPLFFFGAQTLPQNSRRTRLYWALAVVYFFVFAVKLGRGNKII